MRAFCNKAGSWLATAMAFLLSAATEYMYHRIMRMDMEEFGRFIDRRHRPA